MRFVSDLHVADAQVATSSFLLHPEAPQAAPTEKEMSKQGWGQTRIYEVRRLLDSARWT